MVKPLRLAQKVLQSPKKLRTIVSTLDISNNRFVSKKERARFFAKWGRVRLRENFKWSGSKQKHEFILADKINGRQIKIRVRDDNNADLMVLDEVFIQTQYDIKRSIQVRSVLDIGANIGVSGLYFASKYPGAELECVEPLSENLDLLKENLTINGVNARVHELGIGETQGTAWITSTEDNPNQASLHLDGLHKREIKVMPLDALGKQFDLIKFDIEGSEYEMIKGGQRTLLAAKCLLGEIHEDLLGQEKTRFVMSWLNKYFDLEMHPIRKGLFTFVAYRKAI